MVSSSWEPRVDDPESRQCIFTHCSSVLFDSLTSVFAVDLSSAVALEPLRGWTRHLLASALKKKKMLRSFLCWTLHTVARDAAVNVHSGERHRDKTIHKKIRYIQSSFQGLMTLWRQILFVGLFKRQSFSKFSKIIVHLKKIIDYFIKQLSHDH